MSGYLHANFFIELEKTYGFFLHDHLFDPSNVALNLSYFFNHESINYSRILTSIIKIEQHNGTLIVDRKKPFGSLCGNFNICFS